MNYSYYKLTDSKHNNRLARADENYDYSYYINGKWEFINLNEYFFPFGDYNDEYEDITETEAKELMNFWDKEDKVNV